MFPTTVTLKGIESYYNEHDGASIFDEINLPEGIDKDILVPTIIMRAYDFPVLIINPQSINDQTKIWFDSHYDEFEHWIDALNIEYDPLYNYDRDEKEDIARSGSKSGSNSGSSSGSSQNITTTSSTDTTSKSAFNSSSFENYEKDVVSGSGSNTGSTSETHNGQESESNSGEEHRRLIVKGNIGTMTTQDMLQQELDVRKFNIYETIANMYCLEFCVPIY